ncbi:MAG: NAD(P)-dependent oxidoreductase [Jaaginema sp. PMC 1079.18]|nr:NAD(P)-dependent oxidoreductase [Jaaginema sp. PMC 1080.18]MEC4850443.1 NAD(P)-dependent oxidoreductase [Jaaginema sp. PMC 1079.18]MEC4864881.1 NAD(P)-dependent oxidoreductase [Jaaginema sp. PMC 1078.18]
MKISVLGMGLMGAPMALKLAENGYEVTAYNRTPEKLKPLEGKGINTTTDPTAALQASECSILMLSDISAIRSVLLDSETSKQLMVGKTIIQMGTIAPQESKALKDEIVAEYLEAPVLGSIPQVKSGTLQIMVGSTPEQFEQWVEVLKNFGENPLYIGEVGTAAAMKLAMNQLIGSLTTAFASSLGMIEREGVDIEQFMDVLRESALYAPTFDKKLARMRDRDFSNPNFPSKHLLKDINLFIQEAESLGLDLNLVQGVKAVVEKTLNLGLADQDYSALFSAVAGTELDAGE